MQESIGERLVRHGVIVLLLGLLTGFVIGRFHSRTLGDAAHLTGLIGGFGLIAVGLLWPRLKLGRFWSGAGAWMAAVSMYLNWLGLAIQGGFGSGSKGSQATQAALLWDRAGATMLIVAALLSLISTLVILFGLRKLGAPGRTEPAPNATALAK
jgi:hydroxylaminobenzene mutase